LVPGQSIAQAAPPGIRSVPGSFALQNDDDISLKTVRLSHLAVQNYCC
jgi:hypothetical protein